MVILMIIYAILYNVVYNAMFIDIYTSRSKEDSVRQSAVPITVERNE